MLDTPILSQSRKGPVLTLTLNRPQQGNSLSSEMIRALQDALDAAEKDTGVHVVVIAAEGARIFCAGHDLKEFQSESDPRFHHALSRECSRMMQTVRNLRQPVIAKVRGIATAAGCQLVAACDLAVAADDARFATPGVNIGFWCHTPQVAVSRAVAPKHAMEMLLTGEPISASRAYEIGLVNRIVPEADLDAATDELAQLIASKSSYTVAIGKESFYRQLPLDLPTAYDYVCETALRNMLAEDAKEGIAAFVEKRKPEWKGR